MIGRLTGWAVGLAVGAAVLAMILGQLQTSIFVSSRGDAATSPLLQVLGFASGVLAYMASTWLAAVILLHIHPLVLRIRSTTPGDGKWEPFFRLLDRADRKRTGFAAIWAGLIGYGAYLAIVGLAFLVFYVIDKMGGGGTWQYFTFQVLQSLISPVGGAGGVLIAAGIIIVVWVRAWRPLPNYR